MDSVVLETNSVNHPLHYDGNGFIRCEIAAKSMHRGWDRYGYDVGSDVEYWMTSAFKYIWRFSIKAKDVDGIKDDIDKAIRCLELAKENLDNA